MQPLPRINDIVIISYPGRETRSYSIVGTNPTQLSLADLFRVHRTDRLILQNNQWKLVGADVNYNIEIIPVSQIGINKLASDGHLEVLKIFAVNGIYPDKNGASQAAIHGHFEIIEWLLRDVRRDYFDSNISNELILNGEDDILQWLMLHEISLDVKVLRELASLEQLEVLKLLIQYHIYPSQNIINYVTLTGKLEIAKLLSTHNLYPDQKFINMAAGNGHLELLKWLGSHNLYPNQEGVDAASNNGHMDILRWLLR